MKRYRGHSTFSHISTYNCSAEELYLWHSHPGALQRLLPSWEKTDVLRQTGGIDPGARVELKMHVGPFRFRFEARHVENIPGRMFKDIQEKGPFSSWSHTHFFENEGEKAKLTDHIEYALPAHNLLPPFITKSVTKKLEKLFAHRQKVLANDLALHQKCSSRPLRILISGASGILGRELLPLLKTGGHQVWTLVRRPPEIQKNEIFWDPIKGILNKDDLPELDGVIHLAGEYIGLGRWGEERKQRVVDSRVKGTGLLCRTLAGLNKPPGVFLCASAVGYYGNCGNEIVDESHPPGTDFISEVCRQWEQSAKPAQNAGIRTIFMRLGVALTPKGGGLQKILSSSPLGFIRRFGSGHQYISWMSSDDMISAMLHALTCEALEGPLNIAAPEPVTNLELMQTLVHVTGRPLLFPVSAKILHLLYGQMASEILLSGCRISTRKLQDSGFTFRHPSLTEALEFILGT